MLIGVAIWCNKCEKEMIQNAPQSDRFICSGCLHSVTITVVTKLQDERVVTGRRSVGY
jgi:hypothetical protein